MTVEGVLNNLEVQNAINEALAKLLPSVGQINVPIVQGTVHPEWLANSIAQLRVSNLVLKLQLTAISGLVNYMLQRPFHPDSDYDKWVENAIECVRLVVSDIGEEYEEAIKEKQQPKIVVPTNNKIIV